MPELTAGPRGRTADRRNEGRAKYSGFAPPGKVAAQTKRGPGARPHFRIDAPCKVSETEDLKCGFGTKQVCVGRAKEKIEVQAVTRDAMERHRLASNDHVIDVDAVEGLAEAREGLGRRPFR